MDEMMETGVIDTGFSDQQEDESATKGAREADVRELAKHVVKADITNARQSNSAGRAKREKFYSLYRARGDEGKSDRPGRSTIPGSDVMNCIEWTMPDMMKAFAGNQKVISVIPRGSEDVKKAEKIEKLLNWQFMHQCQGFLTLQSWIKASFVYGIAHLKTGWEEQYDYKGFAQPKVMEPQFQQLMDDDSVETLSYAGVTEIPMSGMAGGAAAEAYQQPNGMNYTMQPAALESMRVYMDVQGERKIKTYSGPKLEVVPPDDFLIDPEAKDVDTARFVIHRVKRTISYLRKLERDGVYSNIDKVVKLSEDGFDAESDNDEATMRAQAAEDYAELNAEEQDGGDTQQVGRRRVEVYEWWGELDVEGDGRTEPYLVVMCRDVIIRMERNPYAHGKSPFVDLCPIMDIFRYEGIGYAELAGPHQEVKTAIVRQILDNVSFTNNQMWEVDENSGVDTDALINPFPGRVVFTNRLGGVKPITPAQLDGSAYNLLEFCQGQLEQLTGVTRYNQGMDAKTLNKTATGISAIMNASNQRKELIARTIAETGLRKLFQKMLQLDQQFVDQNIVVRLFNEPLEISPDDLAGNFDVSVDIGSSVTDDNTQVQQLFTVLQQSPFLMQLGIMQPNNVFEVCKKILSLWGYKNSELFLSDPKDAEMARQVMEAIVNLGNAVQMGQMPPLNVIAQVLQAAYMVLAKIAGGNIQQQEGTISNGENGTSDRSGGTAQRTAGTPSPSVIPVGYGRNNEAGGVLSTGGA